MRSRKNEWSEESETVSLSVSLSIRYTIWIVVVFGIRLILLSPVCSDKRSNRLIIVGGMRRCRCPQISISFCTSTNRLTATTFGQATLTQTFPFRTHRTNLWAKRVGVDGVLEFECDVELIAAVVVDIERAHLNHSHYTRLDDAFGHFGMPSECSLLLFLFRTKLSRRLSVSAKFKLFNLKIKTQWDQIRFDSFSWPSHHHQPWSHRTSKFCFEIRNEPRTKHGRRLTCVIPKMIHK